MAGLVFRVCMVGPNILGVQISRDISQNQQQFSGVIWSSHQATFVE